MLQTVSQVPDMKDIQENRKEKQNPYKIVDDEKSVGNKVCVSVGNASKACLYLRVKIANRPLSLLNIDTGSPFSIINKGLADSIGVKIQNSKVNLSSPDGRKITVFRKAEIDLEILGRKICEECIVANLDKVNLLRIDFLENQMLRL